MMRNWNRREFTRNVGMLTLFSPFISLLDPSVARAQASTGPAKYLLIITSNGTDPGVWNPAGSSPNSITFSSMTEPLAAIRNDVILLNQFDSRGTAGSHGAVGGLTGSTWGAGNLISLDFFVAEDLRRRGILTQVPSLHLGGVNGQPGIGFRNNALQAPQFSLSEAFRSIFDGTAPPPVVDVPGAPVATGPSEQEIRLLRRKSILDRVTGEVNQLRGAFNGIEREKLDLHLDSIRQLEERIAQQLSLATGEPAPSTGGGAPGPSFIQPVNCERPGNLPGGLQPIENSAVHLELAMTAFACDITRVAHVEFGHHQSCPVNIPGASGDWHNDFMHASANRTPLINTEKFICDRFVEAVAKLKATPAPDGDGNLYDQTFILWVREMGDAVIHAGDNMPYVVSGGAGGYLRPGNGYLNGGGAFHLRVLMNAAEAMGATNLSGFGGTGAGPSDRTPYDQLKG
jgi:hypothetical protein